MPGDSIILSFDGEVGLFWSDVNKVLIRTALKFAGKGLGIYGFVKNSRIWRGLGRECLRFLGSLGRNS